MSEYFEKLIAEAKSQERLSFQVKEKLFQLIKSQNADEDDKKNAVDLLCQHKQMFLIVRLVRDFKVEFKIRKYASNAARSVALVAA